MADEDVPLCVGSGKNAKAKLFLEDLEERGTKFRSSRADITSYELPEVIRVLQNDVTVERGKSDCCSPFNIRFLPPFAVFAVYTDGAKALRAKVVMGCSDYALKISSIEFTCTS